MTARAGPPRDTDGSPPETDNGHRAPPTPQYGPTTRHPSPPGAGLGADRSQPLARLSTAAQAIEGLRDLFTTEEPLDDASVQVAVAAVRAVEHADIVSITVLSWPDARTTAATDDRARTLDDQQYASGRGPCLQAAWDRTPITGLSGDTGDRCWPEFAAAARKEGVLASLSIPLLVGGLNRERESVGSLNMYSVTAAAFDPFDEALGRVYAVAAGQAMTNARRWQHSRETVDHLQRAVTSRTEIDLAKGMLMALHGCDEDEAFDRLKTESQHRNVKLRLIAHELLAYVRTPSVA